MTRQPPDAVVVGAGHNGLIAAAYLARAGVRVTVVERRDVIGGATVTEELAPGIRTSAASYAFGLLRPDIHRDLELERHGLVIRPKDPQMFVPLPDGRHFFVWRDAARTREELARIWAPDADGYTSWSRFWDEAVRILRPVFESEEPPSLDELQRWLGAQGREDVWRLAVTGSVADTVCEFFGSEEVRGAFATQGLIGTNAGPHHPGTAWVMAFHAMGGELVGMDGSWASVRGGMGALAEAVRRSCESHGVRFVCGTAVNSVLIDDGRATGIELDDGTQIPASVVLSGADPKTTFLRLVPEGVLATYFEERVQAWPTPGSVVKVNIALSEPPDFTARHGTGPQHQGTIEIAPSLDYLQAAFESSRGGRCSERPWMEVFVQTSVDPTLAPEGTHVLSAFSQYAPAEISDWPRQRKEAGDAVIATLSSYAPNVAGSVIACDVLGPPDLEERFGLTGGNIFHGEILPENCFAGRFGYRTPVPGLYLCGSGAHPGGGVTGAPGRNAARAVLGDLTSDEQVAGSGEKP
ncbi:MAG TPA: NAD(P)/FAD-dependent oxidoreductase [Actinomycetota bacterium]|nr:NAD(P)/FAD-dependent oxidoreductase [Actinomycetota bacterium]